MGCVSPVEFLVLLMLDSVFVLERRGSVEIDVDCTYVVE